MGEWAKFETKAFDHLAGVLPPNGLVKRTDTPEKMAEALTTMANLIVGLRATTEALEDKLRGAPVIKDDPSLADEMLERASLCAAMWLLLAEVDAAGEVH